MPTLQRLHHQDERRQLQPHDVCRVRLRVLLALHEGDLRPALPQVSGAAARASPGLRGGVRCLRWTFTLPLQRSASEILLFLTQRGGLCPQLCGVRVFSSHTEKKAPDAIVFESSW